MLDRLSLRARLVLGVILLAAVGLAAADVATYTSLRSFLLQRTDASLNSTHAAVETLFRPGAPAVDPHDLDAAAGGDYVQLRSFSGNVIFTHSPRTFGDQEAPPAPALPQKLSIPGQPENGPDRAHYFTVPAASGSLDYRVRASIEPGANYVLIVATSLKGVEDTLHRLLWIELLVTVAVLAALAALGLWVVRLGLRPLTEIGKTAAAIEAGDLSRRVEREDQRSEVGRLGHALNSMLAQIETAFNAQAASERRLRRFVADASHELRTPLAAVRAYAELFERGADRRPDDLARAMSGIGRESERMSLLVDDLLLLARLDEGRPLEREPVVVGDVVGEAVETARTLDPERPIDLQADEAVVVGDRNRLRQVVDNLLSNVRAHTPAKTPVHVSVSRSNGNALIEVADEGPGLDEEHRERVFERFYRADASRARARGGVGLGLSIVAAVAEAHGGAVSARSERGRGATFLISLPLADGDGAKP